MSDTRETLLEEWRRVHGAAHAYAPATARLVERLFAALDEELKPTTLADAERRAVMAALKQTEGRVAAAARILGISRTTLWRRLKRYGVRT